MVSLAAKHRAPRTNQFKKKLPSFGRSLALAFILYIATFSTSIVTASAQTISQKTFGPCSPASVNATLTLNCVVIPVRDLIAALEEREQYLSKQAARGNDEAKREADFLRRKLADPDALYRGFLTAATKHIQQLNSLQQKVGLELVRDAAAGKQDAPQKIILALSDDSQATVSYVLSLGELLEAQGDFTGARAAYEKARQLMPFNGAILRKYANLLYEFGRATESIEILQEVLKKNETEDKLTNADLAWVYDGLGESLQGVGKLDAATEQFRFARQVAGPALKDGSLSKTDYGSILNDSAGPAIRRRDFITAERYLCSAVSEFITALGESNRTTINAELNLTVVWREMGNFGDAKTGIRLVEKNAVALGTKDPYKGYIPLILAQLEFALRNYNAATTALDTAYSRLNPQYQQFGAHAQRVGRIFQIRSRIAYWNSSLSEAISLAKLANRFFDEAYRANSFDELTVNFGLILSLVETHNAALASEYLAKFRTGLERLRLDHGEAWLAYERYLNGAVAMAKVTNTTNAADMESALVTLFGIEKTSNGYDLLTDDAIVHFLRTRGAKTVTPALVADYRARKKAMTAVITSRLKSFKNCTSVQ